jgi:hypothetical protein
LGYETNSTRTEVYPTFKTSQVESFERALKNDMATNMPTLFVKGGGGGSLEIKFLGEPQTLVQETWPLKNSNSRHF